MGDTGGDTVKDKAGDAATNELGNKLGTRWKTQGGSIARQMDTKLGDKGGKQIWRHVGESARQPLSFTAGNMLGC